MFTTVYNAGLQDFALNLINKHPYNPIYKIKTSLQSKSFLIHYSISNVFREKIHKQLQYFNNYSFPFPRLFMKKN